MNIKFEFLYKGMKYSSDNDDCPWFKKVYTLDQITEKPIKELSDVHGFAELIAKRQFTGLKDKNGAEIYEGDIVKTIYGSTTKIEAVKYEADIGFTPIQEPCDYDEIYLSACDIEIIGNIHQNPELLK